MPGICRKRPTPQTSSWCPLTMLTTTVLTTLSMINRWRRRWSSPTRTAIMADRNTTIDIDVPGMALATVRAMSAPRGTRDAPSRDRGHQQRDQEIVAGQRQAEEAPLHFVAANHPHGVETLQQIAGAAEISNGAGAVGRPLPKTPF